MDPLRLFQGFVNKFVPLTDDEFSEHLLPAVQLRKFKKKDIISQAGEVERFANFVGQGLVRKYLRKDSEELNTQIAMEGQLIYSQASLNKQTASHYYLQALEPTVLVSIEFDALNRLFATNAKMERWGRLVATEVTVLNERWQMMMLQLTPRERFVSFVTHNTGLMQRVPQKLLASLLNIQPETFSRFKHLLRTVGAEPALLAHKD